MPTTRRLLALLLPLLAPVTMLAAVAPASAAPGSVQVAAREVASGGSVSAPFTASNTAGNLVVVHVMRAAGASRPSPTPAATSTAAGPVRNWRRRYASQVFWARNGTGAQTISRALTTTNPTDLLLTGVASANRVTAVAEGWTTRSTFAGNRTADRAVTAPASYTATATRGGARGRTTSSRPARRAATPLRRRWPSRRPRPAPPSRGPGARERGRLGQRRRGRRPVPPGREPARGRGHDRVRTRSPDRTGAGRAGNTTVSAARSVAVATT